jgi:hypothetical protein
MKDIAAPDYSGLREKAHDLLLIDGAPPPLLSFVYGPFMAAAETVVCPIVPNEVCGHVVAGALQRTVL